MKKPIILIALIVGIIVLSYDTIINGLLLFLLAGVIPGINVTLPFWVMLALYCLLITAVVTLYIEGVFDFLKSQKNTPSRKSRLPRRRYNTI